ncbi:hypothetical protein [Streptomyces sp. NPDC056921]|uniref:hypothetical protein n=1 Tax=Streptomyces sp. NPDC056921 TaxID=3345966 RepID=UPI003644B1A9
MARANITSTITVKRQGPIPPPVTCSPSSSAALSSTVSAITRGRLRNATRNNSPACTAHAHPPYGLKGG